MFASFHFVSSHPSEGPRDRKLGRGFRLNNLCPLLKVKALTSVFIRICFQVVVRMGALECAFGSVLHYQPSRKTFLLMAVALSACCSSVRFEFS